jgi:hypothetical protein
MGYEHLLIFSVFCVATWLLVTYLYPRLLLSAYKRAILVKGFGDGPVPINTLYTEPPELFADPLTPQSGPGSNPVMAGMNRDTLILVGWLNLSKGPLVLHVPDMAGRYYSVQFTDPSKNVNFAYVGKRTTGTKAGDYLIAGPGWKETVPDGMTQIPSPNNSVLLVGRVFVENTGDLSTAYALAKQTQLAPLNS